MRAHVNLQKKSATQKLEKHAHDHFFGAEGARAKQYTAEDHADAAGHHAVESRNPNNSDRVRAFHGAIADAHSAKAAGKETPHNQREKKLEDSLRRKLRREADKEKARKTSTVGTTAGGHAIQNTHHVRYGGFGPEIITGPKSKSEGNKFARESWMPIETEFGEHLTPEQHKDIAAHHQGKVVEHLQHIRNTNLDYTTRANHRNAALNHQHAQHEHEAHAEGVHHIESVAKDAEDSGEPKKAEELRAQAKKIRDDLAEKRKSKTVEKAQHPFTSKPDMSGAQSAYGRTYGASSTPAKKAPTMEFKPNGGAHVASTSSHTYTITKQGAGPEHELKVKAHAGGSSSQVYPTRQAAGERAMTHANKQMTKSARLK